MTKRDRWIAIGLLIAAVMAHAVFPRYEWRDLGIGIPRGMVRIDRWTGGAVLGTFGNDSQWVSLTDYQNSKVVAAKIAADAKTKAEAVPTRQMPLDVGSPENAVVSAGGVSESVPIASLSDTPPLCDSKAVLRPPSGSELGGKYRGGLGRVKIINGTERDAAVELIDGATQEPKRAIYVRSGETGAITSVPIGNYLFRFQFGAEWLRERRFCQPTYTSEFDSAFDFREVDTGGGKKYSTFELTLHPVVDGTAKTNSLPNSEFILRIPDAGLEDFAAIARKFGGVPVK